MDIKNIALVRATNIIPFDGIVHPISEVAYLKKERGTAFAYAMNDLLKKLSKINIEGYWTKTEDEQMEMDRRNKEVLEGYLPYNSDYNSMVLWSLNGLVPDDMNNTFSNKTCAVIESLEDQIDSSEIISLVPTDTAIKGNVKLSKQAIILISKDRYESLSQEEKEQLDSSDLTVQTFDTDLQGAVGTVLEESKRYTSEKLSLTRANKGYYESETSEDLKATIQDVAQEHNIAQVLHWNVLTGQNDELEKLSSVKDEFKNHTTVVECYQSTFLQYLFSKLAIDKNVCVNMLSYKESPVYAKALCGEIERIGIDEYKAVIDQYNHLLETLKQQGKLPTPEQIVAATKANRDYTLNSLIEESEKNIEENKENTKMNEYLKKLQEKYGYNKELTEALGKIVPAFVEHFGQENEQLILDAISSCEIHMQQEKEDLNKFIAGYFPNKNIGSVPSNIIAFYDSMPILTDEGVSSKRIIYLRNSDLKNDRVITTLVHEMGHLIKSFKNEFSIENGQIVQRSGISRAIINRDEETGEYSSGEEFDSGIEEAINCYDEEKIMNIILGREFTKVSYFYHLNEAINPLLENKELMEAFRKAQLQGTNEHIRLIGNEDFERLSKNCEEIYIPLIQPIKAMQLMGGVKGIKERQQQAKADMIKYGEEFKNKLKQNFSIKQIAQLDKTVSPEKRKEGMNTLKKETYDNTREEMGENGDDPRI